MELGNVVDFLENKTILITGGTGFLAKIFLEKVLRVQPNVKKFYLLLRASDAKAAAVRFQNEIISKDLFKVLKEMWGVKFSSLVSEKVSVVPGDISISDLGVKDYDLREQMLDQIDAIVNLAATTKFDERYDVSLDINTLGAKHVVEFAKQCTKLKILVHVSTAYVCGEKGGLIEERSYDMGQTLNGASGLDIDAEVQLANEKLKELSAMGSSPKEISKAMRDLGISRAKEYGWPNTYVFTKAMGEMLVGQSRSGLPVVISRPTIISSTYLEPFPGWVEGVRTIDSIIVSYGKGKLQCFLCDPQGTFDVIPADMVVNSIIVAMAANAGRYRPSNEVIYQIGSSLGNPMRYCKLEEYGYRHFSEHPWINKEGKAVIVGRVKILSSMGTYLDMSRKIDMVMRLIELYRPYLFFEGVFDDMNTEKLRAALRINGTEADMFYFDPKCIDWDDYFRRVHFPGLVKYVLK